MRKTKEPSPPRNPLDAIFRPRSVAVVGASRQRNSIGREILRNIVEFEYAGPVYPVNPAATVVNSMKCFASVEEIPGPVDLAIIVVPRELVLDVVDACGRKGVKGLVTITAGFREADGAGGALEEKLKAKLDRYGMRMIGPNCVGVINTEPDVRLNGTFAASIPNRGNVGFISQSGALGEAILADATESGIGVAMFVSMGNKTDISGNDLIEYWEHNPDVEVILMYLESFGNPRKFTHLARRVTRRKPIITVKAGRTAAGARAASSHTGSIVGLDIASESLLEQCGILRVESMKDLFVQAAAFANQPVPAGNRIAIVTNAGGPGILCTDALIGKGIELAEFSSATRKSIAKLLPAEASVSNPIDMIASATGERYRQILGAVRKDPGVDGIIAIFVSPITIDAFEVARAIAEASDGQRPILSVFMGKMRTAEGIAELRRHRVPVYRFPEEAAAAMAAMCRYRALRDRPMGKEVRFKVDQKRARRAVAAARRAKRTDLTPPEVQEVLAAYGFPLVPARICATPAEAIAASSDLGYPVVAKVASARISHKTDVGGVRVDLRNGDEVAAAFKDFKTRLGKTDPGLRMQVQKMIQGGREVILGMVRDPQFGPLMMFGLGGIFVEVMKDVSVRIHPLTDVGAKAMIQRVKGFPLLAGARGEKAVAIGLLEESLLRLSQLVGDFGEELQELDLNPLIVTDDPERSFVVDARISLTK